MVKLGRAQPPAFITGQSPRRRKKTKVRSLVRVRVEGIIRPLQLEFERERGWKVNPKRVYRLMRELR